MLRHAKTCKFKRPLSQNEEPFGTEICLYKVFYSAVIPRESRNSEESTVS